MKISIKLRRLRAQGKFSQAEIAEELQVSQTAYNKWESGTAKPCLENIIKLCSYYNIDIAELLDDTLKVLPDEVLRKEIIISNEEIQCILQNQEKLIGLIEEQNKILIRILKCEN